MSDTADSRPVLEPGTWTLRGKNPETPEMAASVDTAAEERLKSNGTWTSERVSPSDGHSETLEMFNKAVEAALKNPQVVKTIEDRAEGAKQAYEYFLGPQQYWRFTYKGRIYSLCSASNTPIDLQKILDAIDSGRMSSEPDDTSETVINAPAFQKSEPACEFVPPKEPGVLASMVPEHRAYWGS